MSLSLSIVRPFWACRTVNTQWLVLLMAVTTRSTPLPPSAYKGNENVSLKACSLKAPGARAA